MLNKTKCMIIVVNYLLRMHEAEMQQIQAGHRLEH